MPLVSTQYEHDGIVRIARGSRTGTRTAGNFTLTLGFDPKYVKVTNLTDRVGAEWWADGTDGTKELVSVAAGTRTYADGGISVAAGVVSVVVATVGLETDNDDVVWEAHG